MNGGEKSGLALIGTFAAQQYIGGARTAIPSRRGAKRQYVTPLGQPLVDLLFEYRLLCAGTASLAMNDANAAEMAVPAFLQKIGEYRPCFVYPQAMQVNAGVRCDFAPAQIRKQPLLNAGADKQQFVVGLDVAVGHFGGESDRAFGFLGKGFGAQFAPIGGNPVVIDAAGIRHSLSKQVMFFAGIVFFVVHCRVVQVNWLISREFTVLQ